MWVRNGTPPGHHRSARRSGGGHRWGRDKMNGTRRGSGDGGGGGREGIQWQVAWRLAVVGRGGWGQEGAVQEPEGVLDEGPVRRDGVRGPQHPEPPAGMAAGGGGGGR